MATNNETKQLRGNDISHNAVDDLVPCSTLHHVLEFECIRSPVEALLCLKEKLMFQGFLQQSLPRTHFFMKGNVEIVFRYRGDDAKKVMIDVLETGGRTGTVLFLKESLKNCLRDCDNSIQTPLRRCADFNVYYPTTDNNLIQYDFDRVVFSETSRFQDVQIKHSRQFGNVLILDGDINMGESDLCYTNAILGSSRENFENKTVLVLGGGDGGVLAELKKRKPAWVEMYEIDDVVIKACAEHLRGVSFDSLDRLEGPNWKVVVDDCFPHLEKHVKEGKTFDYVINDLTALPVATEEHESAWAFFEKVLYLSLKCLSKSGHYICQANGANHTTALEHFDKLLRDYNQNLKVIKDDVFVPSFQEKWRFYDVSTEN